jgi:hypothetical protein
MSPFAAELRVLADAAYMYSHGPYSFPIHDRTPLQNHRPLTGAGELDRRFDRR